MPDPIKGSDRPGSSPGPVYGSWRGAGREGWGEGSGGGLAVAVALVGPLGSHPCLAPRGPPSRCCQRIE